MTGKIDPSRNPEPNRRIPSEEVKKNKSKTLEVGGPILEQRIPNGKKAQDIYADKKMPHQYENKTGSGAELTSLAKNKLNNLWVK